MHEYWMLDPLHALDRMSSLAPSFSSLAGQMESIVRLGASITDSPMVRMVEESMRFARDLDERIASITDSPAMRAMEANTRLLLEMEQHAAGIADSPMVRMIEESTKFPRDLDVRIATIADSPGLRAIEAIARQHRDTARMLEGQTRPIVDKIGMQFNEITTLAVPSLLGTIPSPPTTPGDLIRRRSIVLSIRCCVCNQSRVWRGRDDSADREDAISIELMPFCACCAEWSARDPEGFARAFREAALHLRIHEGGGAGDGVPRASLRLVDLGFDEDEG